MADSKPSTAEARSVWAALEEADASVTAMVAWLPDGAGSATH